MIQLLYTASQAGVKIDLFVRGICCLKPGIQQISDNIQVTSIVGRFLEHSRIYYFRNGGDEEIYLGSADLMPRNIDRRVEVLFPVQDKLMIKHIYDNILNYYYKDNSKTRKMLQDGTYVRVKPTSKDEIIKYPGLVYYNTSVKNAAARIPGPPWTTMAGGTSRIGIEFQVKFFT